MTRSTPLPSLIEVSHAGGRKAFHQRGQFDDWMRCGCRVTRRVLAGEAMEAGAFPCRRCFPYDPIDTWRATDE